MKYQDHTIVMGKIAVMLLVLVSGCTGFENTSNPNTISSQVPTPTPNPSPPTNPKPTPNPTPTNTPTSPPNPFESVSFPLDSCGDKLPDDSKVYPVTLYRVFLEYSEDNLTQVRSRFCRDAFKKFREDTAKNEIQVASFVGNERANQFKEFVSAKVGISGSIGQPTAIAAKSDRTSAAPSTTNPAPVPEKSPISSLSDFQEIPITCNRKSPSGKFIDLEFEACSEYSNRTKVKNYSANWYEVINHLRFSLIPPGVKKEIDLPSQSKQFDLRPIDNKLIVRRLVGLPIERVVTVNCDDPEINVWGVIIVPKCNSSGSFIEVKGRNIYHNVVVKPSINNSKNIIFRSDALNPSYYVSSQKRQVELTFSVE